MWHMMAGQMESRVPQQVLLPTWQLPIFGLMFHLAGLQAASMPVGRLAVCLFGRVGNFRGASKKFNSDPAALRVAYQSQRRHIIEANERHGWRVDVFVQSPDVAMREEIEALYTPLGSSLEEDPPMEARFAEGSARFGELKVRLFGESVHRAVWLMEEAQRQMAFGYDAVIVLRFDLLFFRDLRVPSRHELHQGLWVGSWCEARGEDSRTYGFYLHDQRCGRLHAHCLYRWGVPDYLFIGSARNISRFARWGPAMDDTLEHLVRKHGKDGADFMLHGGGHTLIYAHLQRIGLKVLYLPGLVEQVDYTVARRGVCSLEIDWLSPPANEGLACQHLTTNGRCTVDVHDPTAQEVCPLEGRRVCVGPHVALGGNCSLHMV